MVVYSSLFEMVGLSGMFRYIVTVGVEVIISLSDLGICFVCLVSPFLCASSCVLAAVLDHSWTVRRMKLRS